MVRCSPALNERQSRIMPWVANSSHLHTFTIYHPPDMAPPLGMHLLILSGKAYSAMLVHLLLVWQHL